MQETPRNSTAGVASDGQKSPRSARESSPGDRTAWDEGFIAGLAAAASIVDMHGGASTVRELRDMIRHLWRRALG